jgi:hypothetical protein
MPAKERQKINLKIFFVVLLAMANVAAMVFGVFRVLPVLTYNRMVANGISAASGVTLQSNPFGTKITFPASMVPDLYGDASTEAYVSRMEPQDGVNSVEQNADGTITLNITRDYHGTMVTEMENNIKTFLTELVNGSGTPSIQAVEYVPDMSSFVIKVASHAFSIGTDKEQVRPLAAKAVFYQGLLGTDTQGTEIVFVDISTESELDKIVYPAT